MDRSAYIFWPDGLDPDRADLFSHNAIVIGTGCESGRMPRAAELEHCLVSRAQLADVAGYADPYRVARTLGMHG